MGPRGLGNRELRGSQAGTGAEGCWGVGMQGLGGAVLGVGEAGWTGHRVTANNNGVGSVPQKLQGHSSNVSGVQMRQMRTWVFISVTRTDVALGLPLCSEAQQAGFGGGRGGQRQGVGMIWGRPGKWAGQRLGMRCTKAHIVVLFLPQGKH